MLCVLDAFDNVLIQSLMPVRSDIPLDLGILFWLFRFDMLDRDLGLFSPLQQLATNVVRSVIKQYSCF